MVETKRIVLAVVSDSLGGAQNMTAFALQQGHIVFCHMRNIDLRPTVQPSFEPFQLLLCFCQCEGSIRWRHIGV